MLKLLLLFCVVLFQANCDDHTGDVHINILVQNYLKLEKETWDLQFDSNYQNNIQRIQSVYRNIFNDIFLSSSSSLIYEPFLKRNDGFNEGSEQWSVTAKYLLGENSESVTKSDAISHISLVFLNDYSKYWNSTGTDYFQILKKKLDEQNCSNLERSVLPTSYVLYSYYNDVSKDLLKTYLLLQLSYIFLKAYDLNDHSNDSLQLRNLFKARVSQIQRDAKAAMETSRGDSWNCIYDFEYSTDTQITNFLQGFVDNEVNLSSDQSCQSSCADYAATKSYACNDGTYCKKMDRSTTNRSITVCDGTIRNCKFIEGNMQVCAASGDLTKTMRYTTIIFDSGKRIGSEFCSHPTKIDSWIRWFVRCSNCVCLCDQITDSDRYFSLRSVLSDTRNNKVITGVAIRKINGIFQWSVTDNKLLTNGQIKQDAKLAWRTSSEFKITDSRVRDGVDYHTLTYEHRGINLDTLEAPLGTVITGIRFQMHNGNLNLEIRVTEFDFNTGLLSGTHEWISNKYSYRFEIELTKPGIPSKLSSQHFTNTKPISGSNHFISFQPTDIDKDISQHTVPFITDGYLRNEKEAYLLSAVGLSWMNIEGTGGIIVPNMVAFNYANYIKVVE